MNLGKHFSQYWYKALKKIIFKDVYEKIEKSIHEKFEQNYKENTTKIENSFKQFLDENNEQNIDFYKKILEQNELQFKQYTDFTKHVSEQNFQQFQQYKNFTKYVSKENINQKQDLIKHLSKITTQNSDFKKQVSQGNTNQKQEMEKLLSDKFTNLRLEFTKQILEKNAQQFDNLIRIYKKQNIQFAKQHKIEKLEFVKHNYEQNNRHLTQNKQILQEFLDKIIGKYQEENVIV